MCSKPSDDATPISCSYDGLTFNPRIAIAILFCTMLYYSQNKILFNINLIDKYLLLHLCHLGLVLSYFASYDGHELYLLSVILNMNVLNY